MLCFGRVLPILVLVLVAFPLGCSKKETRVDLGTKNQIIHLGNGTEIETMDPHIATGVPENRVLTHILEGLVGEDHRDLSPVPAAAESWKISKDQRVYTFKIRSNANWTNGDPVTAHDFVHAWHRMLAPKFAGKYSYMLFYVKNAKAFNEGKIKDFSKVGVKALDAKTLKVTLENPTPFFLAVLQHYSTFPLNRKSIEAKGDFFSQGTEWARPGKMVTNGPFVPASWEVNKVIVLKKSENYWDAATVRLKEVHLYPIDSQQTEERMFRSGQLHQAYELPISKIAVYQKKNPDLLHIDKYIGTYFYRINVTRKPFNDVRVRRAMAMALDLDSLTKNVTKGGETRAIGYTPPGTGGFTSRSMIPYDADRARKLLAEAGFPGGKGFPSFEIQYNTSEKHKVVAEAIQQMWKKELGIDVQLSNQDWKVYLATQRNLDYDVGRAGWIGDYVDPNTFLDMFVTRGDQNQTGWSNKAYDRAIAKAARTSGAARLEAFQEAEAILAQEVPVIPLYTYNRVYLLSPDVKGWFPTIQDHHPLKHVYLSRSEDTVISQNE